MGQVGSSAPFAVPVGLTDVRGVAARGPDSAWLFFSPSNGVLAAQAFGPDAAAVGSTVTIATEVDDYFFAAVREGNRVLVAFLPNAPGDDIAGRYLDDLAGCRKTTVGRVERLI